MPDFNIFRALRVERAEIRHSNWLAFLLSPRESHGQGTLFLDALCRVATRASSIHRSDQAIALIGEQEAGVDREWGRIDVLVRLPAQRALIAIEHKLDADESEGQLSRYAELIGKDFPDWSACLLFLTPDARSPSDPKWVAMGHRGLLDELRLCKQGINASAPPAFCAVLDQYLQLLDERTQQRGIQRQPSGAPDALAERQATTALVVECISGAVATVVGWTIVQRTSRMVRCIPNALRDALPQIGRGKNGDPRAWFSLHYEVFPAGKCVGRFWRASAVAPEAIDQRNQIITALHAEADSGVRHISGSPQAAHAVANPAFAGQTIFRWGDSNTLDPGRLRELISQDLANMTRSGLACARAASTLVVGH
ncbi:MAG: PD-(D/E)XK nuclease family protein [Phycisphaerales bacterium]